VSCRNESIMIDRGELRDQKRRGIEAGSICGVGMACDVSKKSGYEVLRGCDDCEIDSLFFCLGCNNLSAVVGMFGRPQVLAYDVSLKVL